MQNDITNERPGQLAQQMQLVLYTQPQERNVAAPLADRAASASVPQSGSSSAQPPSEADVVMVPEHIYSSASSNHSDSYLRNSPTRVCLFDCDDITMIVFIYFFFCRIISDFIRDIFVLQRSDG